MVYAGSIPTIPTKTLNVYIMRNYIKILQDYGFVYLFKNKIYPTELSNILGILTISAIVIMTICKFIQYLNN